MKKIFTIAAAMLVAATMWANHSVEVTDGVATETWDFAEYDSPNNVTNPDNVDYSGLIIKGGSNNETITKNGFKINGNTGNGTRYIAYTPAYSGTITVYAKANGSSNARYALIAIAQSAISSDPTVGGDIIAVSKDLNGSDADKDHFSANLTASTTYYIEARQGITITKVVYVYSTGGKTPLSASWSDAAFIKGEDASAKLPVFTVSGGSAVLGTDYSVAYSIVKDENNMITLDAAAGIKAINTAAVDTATVRATVTLINTADYSIAATTFDCEITVVKPTCAAPVITFKGYNYAEGKYEFSATCETEGATLQYRLKGAEEYTACVAGEPFFVLGTGDSNDKLIVKATKSGYNEKATTTAYYLNIAPAATSPETLIPYLVGSDNDLKNHAYAYQSVTIGEEDAASSVAGASDANTLKLRTNQRDSTLTLYVHEGYKVTNVTITGKTNNTDATKAVKVVALTVDDAAVVEWAGKDVIFPASSSDAVACSTGAIAASDKITFKFAQGGESAMHTQLIATIVVTYEATHPTAIDEISVSKKAMKVVENGMIVIIRDGVRYDLTGRKL